MAYEFKLPDIGEGVVEGEIVRWLVATGDTLEEDQPMVEVMTDKATVEIPSPVKGTVTKTVGGEGDIIAVGDTLVVIDLAEEGPTDDSEQIEATGADIVITPCHNCHSGIEDIIGHYKLGKHVKFISEIMMEVMEIPDELKSNPEN